MEMLKQKMSSRKLWAAIVGVLTGVAMIFGLDGETIKVVAGAVVTVSSVVSYIMAEGKIDAERIKNAVDKVQDAMDVLDDPE